MSSPEDEADSPRRVPENLQFHLHYLPVYREALIQSGIMPEKYRNRPDMVMLHIWYVGEMMKIFVEKVKNWNSRLAKVGRDDVL